MDTVTATHMPDERTGLVRRQYKAIRKKYWHARNLSQIDSHDPRFSGMSPEDLDLVEQFRCGELWAQLSAAHRERKAVAPPRSLLMHSVVSAP